MRTIATCFLIFVSHFIHAQCCSPGNPIGGTSNLGVLPSGSWKIIFNYKYSYSGSYYDGAKETTPYFVKSGYFNYAGFLLSHAISDRLTIDLESGYFLNKIQRYVNGILPSEKRGFGITDLSITPKINLLRKNNWEITAGIGLKIPVGPYDGKFDGAIAELDIQPSSGATDFNFTLFISKEYLEKKLRFFLYNQIALKGTNPLYYKYGNLYSTAIFGSYSFSPRFDLIFQVRNELRAKDERPSQNPPYATEKIPISGSDKLFIVPQLNFSGDQTWSLSILVDFPTYQYYNEQQLANSYAITLVFVKKVKANVVKFMKFV